MSDSDLRKLERAGEDDPEARWLARVALVRAGRAGEAGIHVGDLVEGHQMRPGLAACARVVGRVVGILGHGTGSAYTVRAEKPSDVSWDRHISEPVSRILTRDGVTIRTDQGDLIGLLEPVPPDFFSSIRLDREPPRVVVDPYENDPVWGKNAHAIAEALSRLSGAPRPGQDVSSGQ